MGELVFDTEQRPEAHRERHLSEDPKLALPFHMGRSGSKRAELTARGWRTR